jgi:hypothetical protein
MTEPGHEWTRKFHEDLAADAASESRLLVKELAVLLVIVVLIVLREWLV